jgi:glutamyl-Q tRNA(Asp) synthetase
MTALDLTGLRLPAAPLVTRFAPSPTGYLHLGHVVNAIYVWGLGRALGARVLLRIEDHDRLRCRRAFEHALLEDLEWLGFVPDEGVEARVRQSDRASHYTAALERLRAAGEVYPCRCSRREIAGEYYPGTCRTQLVSESETPARRLHVAVGAEAFDDLLRGHMRQDPGREYGDLLIRDRHDHWTYQFAVTVDDIDQRVNLVIRGDDLLSSTGRQLHLARLLGRTTPPIYAHHPLILAATGRKLSKADAAVGIRELRREGLSPAHVVGRAAAAVGLVPDGAAIDARTVSRFWDRI